MTAKILDGRLVSDFLLKGVKSEVDKLKRKRVHPKLAIILVGDNSSSLSYVKSKERAATKTGIECETIHLKSDVKEKRLLDLLEKLNKNELVHGVLVQMPLPKHIDENKIKEKIEVLKDVDGFRAENLGNLFISRDSEFLVPCTAKGIIKMLEFYKINPEGKNIAVVGRSNLVGKPVAMMLLNRNATVVMCHSKTKNLESITKQADVLIVAVGKPGMIKAKMIKKGCVIIDVGITKVFNKITGDVDFENIKNKAGFVSPVPGGVGLMTVSCLMENVVIAATALKDKQKA